MTATEKDREEGSIEEFVAVKKRFDIKIDGEIRSFEFEVNEETKEVQNIIIVNPYGEDREVQPIEILAIEAILKWAGLKLGELK